MVAGLRYEDLHPFGVERARASTVIEAARRMGRLGAITGLGFEDGYRRLGAVRGIGPWTAGIVMGAACGDPDAVPIGDYHLPNLVAWVLAGEPRADDDRMLALLEPYRGTAETGGRPSRAVGDQGPELRPEEGGAPHRVDLTSLATLSD